jgi:hypothetical protein
VSQPAGPIVLRLTAAPGPAAGPGEIPVRVCFHNASHEPVRLLAVTEPVPVFFSFSIVDADGTPVPAAGGGKIDFGPEGPGYVQIEPGGDWCVGVDLSSLLARPLAPGSYRVGVQYHNQYGDNCFRGQLTAGPVVVHLGR